MVKRCDWCSSDPLYIEYHDQEWGVPVHDDKKLFEMLILEGAQAGLSWIVILKKRQAYRRAFDAFDFRKIADYSQNDVDRLLADPGIVRNRLKIQSTIKNARGVEKIIKEFGSLNAYFWQYVDWKPYQSNLLSNDELPAMTPTSIAISKDLKKRGFNFVGPTICYAFMQSIGMVNDHVVDCYRHKQIDELV